VTSDDSPTLAAQVLTASESRLRTLRAEGAPIAPAEIERIVDLALATIEQKVTLLTSCPDSARVEAAVRLLGHWAESPMLPLRSDADGREFAVTMGSALRSSGALDALGPWIVRHARRVKAK